MSHYISSSLRNRIRKSIVIISVCIIAFSGIVSMASSSLYGADMNTQNQSKGIDVSAFNGNIDWRKVAKDHDVEWAIIRAAGRFGGSGKIFDDSYFNHNIESASKQNIPIGVYFFSQAVNEKEAREEAAYICNKIKAYNISLPVAIDIERVGDCRQDDLSVSQLTGIALAFCEEVSSRGYTPMVYSNIYELNNRMNLGKLSNYNIWVAQYYKECQLKSDYYIWQYSSQGRVDGIEGNVDKNILYKDKVKAGYGWIKTGDRYRYLKHDGSYYKDGWAEISGHRFYFDSDGWMVTGWIKDNSRWYYTNNAGYMLKGWQKLGDSWYYFHSDGHMASDEIIDGWKLLSDGKCISTGWRQDSTGWWYRSKDGGYYKDGWQKIDGSWFYFDEKGYIRTGWLHINNDWFYLNEGGYMVTGWQKIEDSWYYFHHNGKMASDEIIDGWKLYGSGRRVEPGWNINESGRWYRSKDGGYYKDGWQKIDGGWFYFDEKGYIRTGWLYSGSKWYYLNNAGYMVTGWQKIDGAWYYMYENGSMASDTSVDGYHLGPSGKME